MKKVVLIFVCSAVFSSCRKDNAVPAGNQTISGAGIAGNITGKTTQYDMYAVQLTTGLNNVTVSIDGAGYSTVTDASGNYTLSNIQPGTYNVSFNKTGCGLWQQQQVSFAGNGTYYLNGYSTEKPTYNINGSIKDSILPPPLSSHRIFANLSFGNPLPKAGGLLVIKSASSNLNVTDPDSYQVVYLDEIPANLSQCSLYLEASVTGTWYFTAYAYPNTYNARYYNVQLEKYIYSSYGTSLGTFTVVVP